MRKLLTILLTLVMAICLVNLNNSSIKGEDVETITGGVKLDSANGVAKVNASGATISSDIISVSGSDNNIFTFNKKTTVTTTGDTYALVETKNVQKIINLNGDLTIRCYGGGTPIFAEHDITINGNGHTLTLSENSSAWVIYMYNNKKLTLNDVKLRITKNCGSGFAILAGDLALTNGSDIIVNSSGGTSKIIEINNEPTGATVVKGKAADGVMKTGVWNGTQKTYVASDDSTKYFTKHISINFNPTPDPQQGEMPYDDTNGFTGSVLKTQATDLVAHLSGVSQSADTVVVKKGDTTLTAGTDYTLDGSLKVTFKSTYLNNLDAGDNVFSIIINDAVTFKATITAKDAPTPDPQQGEMPYDQTNGFTGTVFKTAASNLTAHIKNVKKGTDTIVVKEGQTTLTENTDYTTEAGTGLTDSTKVIFKDTYLNNLTVGTHIYTISINNTFTFKVTLTVRNKPTPAPETGEMPYDQTNGFTGAITKTTANVLTAHIGNAIKGTDTIVVKEGQTTLTEDTEYTVESGTGQTDSVKVKFKSTYLDNLSAGTHIYTISINNKFDFKVTITVRNKPTPAPETGEMPYDQTNGFTGTITKTVATPLTAHIADVIKGTDTIVVKEGQTTLTENTDYTTEAGTGQTDSTKVIFKDTYLNNLTVGTHIYTISINNTFTFKVTITVKAAPHPISPKAGTDDMGYNLTNGFTGAKLLTTASTLSAHIGAVTTTDTIKVTKGGTALTKDTDYEIEDVQGAEESIRIRFKANYLNGLDAGTHTLNININDAVNFVVTIKMLSQPTPIDPTPGTSEMEYDKVKKEFKLEYASGNAKAATAHIEANPLDLKDVKTTDYTLVKDSDYIVDTGSVKLTLLPAYLNKLSVGSHEIAINFNNSTSLKVNVTVDNAPSPSPSKPVVKDESCEKVIGPSWHWNNTRGICEEVGVVGTATR